MVNIKSKMKSSWVFDRKTDVSVFGGATILSLLFGYFIGPFEDYVFMYILIDQPHVYSSYLYTYNSKKFFNRFKTFLIIFPIFCFFFNLGITYAIDRTVVSRLLALYSIFHFCKQQISWFSITNSKEKNYFFFERIMDKFVIYFSVAGPALISMTALAGKDGWRVKGDLPVLSDSILPIVSAIWLFLIISYLCVQSIKYYKYSVVTWGKHFHLMNGIIIWSIYRLEPFETAASYGIFLAVFGHSIPYLFLGQKYLKTNSAQEEYFIRIPKTRNIAFFLVISTILIALSEVYMGAFIGRSEIYRSIIISIVFTHYTLDALIWKSKFNGNNLKFLKS
jgi:hypothetical protein